MIRLALSTDARGHSYHATLIASILRRTELPVHVRCWCRGFLPDSFESGPLKVEFLAADKEVTGKYPRNSGPAAYDRLLVIRDCPDWDRCMVMDCDQLVLCDLAPLFEMDLGDHLLAAHMQGPGVDIDYAMRVWLKRPIPEGWEHVKGHPYFLMPPMLNLKAMREAGTWEAFLAAHAAFDADEQLSLTAATEGRTLPLPRKWNLFPKLHIQEHEVPEGVIHWNGYPKPWHPKAQVWRPDIWESEKSSWEQLRMGLWAKPTAIVVEPMDGYGVRALARRGWRVVVVSTRFDGVEGERKIDNRDVNFPDVIKRAVSELPSGPQEIETSDHVRFDGGTAAPTLLERWRHLPGDVVLRGPAKSSEIRQMRVLGYGGERRLKHQEWPTGGPAASVLDFEWGMPSLAVSADEDLYLTRRNPSGTYDPGAEDYGIEESSDEDVQALEGFEPDISPEWAARLESLAGEFSPLTLVQLGPGAGASHLHRLFPEARIRALEHEAAQFNDLRKEFADLPGLELLHAPLDGVTRWYDCRELDFGMVELLVVPAKIAPKSEAIRTWAVNLRGKLTESARVIMELSNGEDGHGIAARWLATGGIKIAHHDSGSIELHVCGPPDEPAMPREIRSMSDIAERTWVISLAHREDRRAELRENWQPLGLEPEWIEGIRPAPADIRWEEMKGMEAYGKAENLRGEYVIGAVGCKRAGISALKRFLESGAAIGLICQDDCRWQEDALETIRRAFQELPGTWNLVYFSASARQAHEPFSPLLMKLKGARLCTAILWNRETALRLLPELESCDCEWDVFMQRKHAELKVFCVVPMPAIQGRSRSDIVGGIVQPPNR